MDGVNLLRRLAPSFFICCEVRHSIRVEKPVALGLRNGPRLRRPLGQSHARRQRCALSSPATKKHKAVTLKAQADESQRVAAHVTTPAKSSGSTGGGYGAHAGQQIRGNLYRGADGKFHSGGAAGGAGKKASGRKSGGGSKGAKPKKSDAQKAADAAAKKAQTAADKKPRVMRTSRPWGSNRRWAKTCTMR